MAEGEVIIGVKVVASGLNKLDQTKVKIAQLDDAARKGGVSVFGLNEKLLALKSAVFTERDLNKVKVYNAEIKATEREMRSLQVTGSNSMGAIGSGANKAFGALRTISYILPGIGIAGLLAFAVSPIVAFISKLGEATAAEKRLADELKAVAALNEETAKNYGKEASALSILRAQIESTNVPMQTRLQAIKNLRAEYPTYFSELSNEQLLTGQVGNAYNIAADAILRKARANAAASAIEELAAKKLEIQLRNLADVEKTNKELATARDKRITRKGTGDAAGTQYTNTAAEQKKGIKIAYDIRRKADQEELDQLNRQIQALLQLTIIGAEETVEIEKDKIKAVKKVREEDFKLERRKVDVKPILVTSPSAYLSELQEYLNREAAGTLPKVTVPIKPEIIIPDEALNASLQQFKVTLEQYRQDINDIINSTFQNGIVSIADAIGDAIGNGGGLKGIFDGLFKTVASGLKELGKYLIKTYGLMAVLEKIKFSNPIVGVAIGAALVVLGAAIESRIGATKAFATGGLVGGTGNRDTVSAMLTPGEFVITKSAVQRIGVDNLAALNRGSVSSSVGAGVTAGTQNLSGTLVASIDGRIIKLALDRANASLSRNG